MPITGRTPKQCFDRFAGHVRSLVAKTLTDHHHLLLVRHDEEQMKLSFHEGDDPIAIPLKTKGHGKVYFYVGQLLRVHREAKEFRLSTQKYWYGLQDSPSLNAQAALRWEYERELEPGKRHCRHHIHQRVKLSLGDGQLNLNKTHVPTGWVTIEEVIRFLIVDLGIMPPCGDEWPKVLENSERPFFEEFSSKRYLPPRP